MCLFTPVKCWKERPSLTINGSKNLDLYKIAEKMIFMSSVHYDEESNNKGKSAVYWHTTTDNISPSPAQAPLFE